MIGLATASGWLVYRRYTIAKGAQSKSCGRQCLCMGPLEGASGSSISDRGLSFILAPGGCCRGHNNCNVSTGRGNWGHGIVW